VAFGNFALAEVDLRENTEAAHNPCDRSQFISTKLPELVASSLYVVVNRGSSSVAPFSLVALLG